MDQNGNKVGARVQGLLLSNGGTVCDDSFSDNSADAICREMGFIGGLYSWRSGKLWNSFQTNFETTLDDVTCYSGEWSSCTYSFEHNCGHSEDVFLTCDGIGEFLLSTALRPCIGFKTGIVARITCHTLCYTKLL